MDKILGFLGWLAIIAVGMAWSGFVLAMLWGWFITPTFGLVALTVPAACGMKLMATFMMASLLPEKPPEKFSKTIFKAAFYPLFILTIGWCIKQWM